MKKSFLAFSALVLALSLTSCLGEATNETTVTKTVYSYNLITPVDGKESPLVTGSLYSLVFKSPDQTVGITVDNLILPGGASASFTTKDISIQPFTVQFANGSYAEVLYFEAEDATDNGSVKMLEGQLSQAAYSPVPANLPGLDRLLPCSTLHFLVMEYRLNNAWNVRTFWPDMTFVGTTKISLPANSASEENTSIAYRVRMQLDANNITDKADMVISNLNLGEANPDVTFVLKDLALEFTDVGYTITGKDIIPSVVAGTELKEMPEYKFDSVEFESHGNLTEGVCSFAISGAFSGSFEGNSMILK